MTAKASRRRRNSHTHLRRDYILDVYRGGVLVFRHRDEPPAIGTLPVYSVDTPDEALMLQVRTCALDRYDNSTYRLNPCYRGDRQEMELSDLYALTDILARIHADQCASMASAEGGRS